MLFQDSFFVRKMPRWSPCVLTLTSHHRLRTQFLCCYFTSVSFKLYLVYIVFKCDLCIHVYVYMCTYTVRIHTLISGSKWRLCSTDCLCNSISHEQLLVAISLFFLYTDIPLLLHSEFCIHMYSAETGIPRHGIQKWTYYIGII